MLNDGQKAAKTALTQWLITPNSKYFVLKGAAGMGKSYLLNDIIGGWDLINKQQKLLQIDSTAYPIVAASTNKAASHLEGATSLHKALGLTLITNYKTGKKRTAKTKKSTVLESGCMIIDESSMLGDELIALVDELTDVNCKVIFVGDPEQLAPVGDASGNIPPVFTKDWPSAELTEPMRQEEKSHLYSQLGKLRDAVKQGSLHLPEEGDGITFLDQAEFLAKATEAMKEHAGEDRVLAYTNSQVEGMNGYLRKQIFGNTELQIGDLVVAANSAVGEAGEGAERTQVEALYEITAIQPGEEDFYGIKCRIITLDNGETYRIPVNKKEWQARVKRLANEARRDGNWKMMFTLSEGVADLREAYSCTVDKSQGSTYRNVYVDLQNLMSCHDRDRLARMIYVACSRAKENVFIYKG